MEPPMMRKMQWQTKGSVVGRHQLVRGRFHGTWCVESRLVWPRHDVSMVQ